MSHFNKELKKKKKVNIDPFCETGGGGGSSTPTKDGMGELKGGDTTEIEVVLVKVIESLCLRST